MKKLSYHFEYLKFNDISELDETRKKLIHKANEAAKNAYVPYSNFHVGAAVLLENGKIITGNNQENASYPVGVCAERTLLSYVHANFPGQKKLKLAISVLDTGKAVSPCGRCSGSIMWCE